ncbi:hypothetical protein [Nonomuraea sp. B5E05]
MPSLSPHSTRRDAGSADGRLRPAAVSRGRAELVRLRRPPR